MNIMELLKALFSNMINLIISYLVVTLTLVLKAAAENGGMRINGLESRADINGNNLIQKKIEETVIHELMPYSTLTYSVTFVVNKTLSSTARYMAVVFVLICIIFTVFSSVESWRKIKIYKIVSATTFNWIALITAIIISWYYKS